MYRCDQILSLLTDKYPSLVFLEGYDNAVRRFNNKQLIIFKYIINNQDFVIKYYNLEHLDGESRKKEKKSVFDEFMIAKAFEGHSNVINVYERNILIADGKEIGAYYTMEYFDLTLDKLLNEKPKFPDGDVMSFLRQMDAVLSYAHLKAGIIHSDIKPANIGVSIKNGTYVYKLMDFDVSVRIEKEQREGQDLNFTISDKINIRGMTPAYAAPEQVLAQINSETTITGKVDTYAVGVIAVQMLTGQAPVPNANSLFYHIPIQQLNKEWYEVLSSICNPDINNRPRRISDILSHSSVSVNNNQRKATTSPAVVSVQNQLAVPLLVMAGIVLLIILLVNFQTKSPSSPSPVQQESTIRETNQNPEERQKQFINQNPEPEKAEEKALQPQYIVVPDIIGRSLSDARNRLKQRNITIQRIIYQDSSPANKDKVLITRPAAGTRMSPENASVILIIGKES